METEQALSIFNDIKSFNYTTPISKIIPTKLCTKCNTTKPLAEFSKNKHKNDGLQLLCKSCANIITATWYKNNPEKIKAKKIKYRKTSRKYIKWNYETCKETASKFTTRNEFIHGCRSAYDYARKNKILDDICQHMPLYAYPTTIKQNHIPVMHLCKTCGETNPINFYKTGKSSCKSCQSNKTNTRYHNLSKTEKLNYKNNLITWQNSNIFRVRISVGKHRAAKKNLEFEITEDFLKSLWEKQNGLCYYSNLPMSLIQDNYLYSLSVERKNSSIGYIESNVVLCCSSINRMKNIIPENEFLSIIKAIYEKNF